MFSLNRSILMSVIALGLSGPALAQPKPMREVARPAAP
jgi:hypothetical protein